MKGERTNCCLGTTKKNEDLFILYNVCLVIMYDEILYLGCYFHFHVFCVSICVIIYQNE